MASQVAVVGAEAAGAGKELRSPSSEGERWLTTLRSIRDHVPNPVLPRVLR